MGKKELLVSVVFGRSQLFQSVFFRYWILLCPTWGSLNILSFILWFLQTHRFTVVFSENHTTYFSWFSGHIAGNIGMKQQVSKCHTYYIFSHVCYLFAADVIHLGFYQKKFWTAQFRKPYAGIALPSCGFLQHCDTLVTCIRLSLLLKHPVDLIFHSKVAFMSHLILPVFQGCWKMCCDYQVWGNSLGILSRKA